MAALPHWQIADSISSLRSYIFSIPLSFKSGVISMKKCILLAAVLSLALPVSAIAADEIKEIKLEGFKPSGRPMTRATMPSEIKTAEELAKTFPQEEVVTAIKKEVDFGKQKLVFFAWSGSGQDKVSGQMAKDEAVFIYITGLTRDLRSHYHLFVVPKDAKVKVEMGKFGK
jgi:hypothetical protein